MAKAIQGLNEYQPPRDTTIIKPLLDALGVGRFTRSLMNQPLLLGFMLNQLSKRNQGDASFIHSLSQMTWSTNVCRGGVKTNTIAGTASVDIDVRVLPGQDEEYVREHFRRALGPLAQKVEIDSMEPEEGGTFTPGTLSDANSPLVELMDSVVKELRGTEFTLVPVVSPGATDCRFFRTAWNTQAYGFAIHDGSMDLATLFSLFHGTNERVPIGTIELTAKGYMELARRFLS
jgi:acetylornithine deacetylase/succinyl-diaminopimelate desuccinylase-like protein